MERDDSFFAQRGNYRSLISFQKAECIYDITYYFATHFLERGDRTVDQMIQAARSGKQNIAEGSAASATSRETEIKLTNVAKASLQELLIDYEDYLRTRGLEKWGRDDRRFLDTRRVCANHSDTAFYMERLPERSAETIANIAIVLINQTDYMLNHLIESQKRAFLKQGGIREEMTRARLASRGGNAPQGR